MKQVFKILVIDDDVTMARALQDFLKRNGYDADIARNAKEALFKLWTGRYDLALTDITMPDVSGLSLLSIIKSIPVPIEVFVITGNDTDENRDDAFRLGARAFIVKPFELDELLKEIQSISLINGRT